MTVPGPAVEPLTYVEGGSISVGYKSECTAQHLPPLWLHVLKLVILGAQDGKWNRQRVQQVPIWVITAEPVPRPLFQQLNNIWSCRLEFSQNVIHSTAELWMEGHINYIQFSQ